MDKQLGVFITTHVSKDRGAGYRAETALDRFKAFLQEYLDTDPEVNVDIWLMDTGSHAQEFLNWTRDLEEAGIVRTPRIPNTGGCFASLKFLMHDYPALAENYSHFLFSVDDDGMHPRENGWAHTLIQLLENNNAHIMGRFLDTIRLGPNGLVDHRNVAPHIAKLWKIEEVTEIPHLHWNWVLMSKIALQTLAMNWNIAPLNLMDNMWKQMVLENEIYAKLAELPDNRKTLDDMHIGREVDFALRCRFLNLRMVSCKTTAVYPNAIEPYKHWKTYDGTTIGPGGFPYKEWKYDEDRRS